MKGERRRIDWEEVRTRLRASQLALEQALTASPVALEAAYRERAVQLANRGSQADSPETTVRVLAFTLRAERYGLPFADLVGLLPFANCTPVPGAPPQLLGVMNVQGEIRSVIDLGQLLGHGRAEVDPAGYVLLVGSRGRAAAFRVEQLEAIRVIAAQEVAAVAADGGQATAYVRGMTADRLRLLDTGAILAHPVFQGSSQVLNTTPGERGGVSPPVL